MAIRFEWSPLVVSDAEALFKAQNEFVQEHYDLTKPHSNTNFDKWKLVLGYPQDDTKRLEFIRNMANGSTKHGKSLHCLKLTRYEGEKAITAGFIDFEVRQISDKNLKKSTVREIYIRSVIVYESMRRQGCGRKLYHALFQYLSPGDLDVIRLYVVDLNQAAVAFYFKLGFKITQWFFRELGAETKTDPGFKAVFLCMQKLQGEQADSGKHQIALQDMPHLFNEQVVGEIVHVDCEDGGSEWTQCARIRVYDKKSNTFTISHADTDNDDDESLVSDLCVNDLFSSGRLYFDTPPSIFLNKGITPCSQIITKSDMAEPSRWPKSGLVQTPEKTRNAEGPRRKRVPWPKSAVSPDGKQESAMDDSSKTLEGPGKGAIVLWAPPLAAVPRHRKQGTQACEYGYEDGKWCKGGTIDFLLKNPAGQQFRVGPWHRISFNNENPKKANTEAFKSYNRYKKATTVYEFCKLNRGRDRREVLRDLLYDVRQGHAKTGGRASRYNLATPPEHCRAKPKVSNLGLRKASSTSTTSTAIVVRKPDKKQPSTLVRSARKRLNVQQSGGPRKVLRSRSAATASSSQSGSRTPARRR